MVRAFQGATSALRYFDGAGHHVPGGQNARGRMRDRASAPIGCRPRLKPTWGSWKSACGLIPAGGGTTEMLARAMEKLPARQADLLPFVQSVVRNPGLCEGLGQRGKRARARIPARCRRHHHESRTADGRRQGARARTRPRGAPAAATKVGNTGWRRQRLRRAQARRAPGLARRPAWLITTRSSARR